MSMQRIGKYTLVRKLGSGAMGAVFEGYDPDIERRVAIKTLHRNLIDGQSGQDFLARFKREAQAAARCMHPNIVTVLEYGQDGLSPYIVMEFIEGQSLDQFLSGYPKLSLTQIVGMFLHVLRGLHAAHKQGIIHRDVKPSNVMITVDGIVKLGDFGIARITAHANQTQTYQLLGTPRYMSPEQAYGSDLDLRSDLYSATLVLMELLRHVHDDRLRSAPLPDHLILPASGQIHVGQLFPEVFMPIFLRGLAPNPAHRFIDAQQFANALKDIIDGRPALAGELPLTVSAETQQLFPAARHYNTIPRTLPADLEHLAVEYLGPLAYNLIRHVQSSSGSGDGLLSALAARIADDHERQRFIVRWRQLARSDRSSYSSLSGADTVLLTSTDRTRLRGVTGMQLDEDTLSLLSYHYAHFIGPLAQRLVRIHLSHSHNAEELLQNLADKIPHAGERQTFLRKARDIVEV